MKIAYSVRDLMVLAAAEAINGNVIRCYGSPTSEAAADALIQAIAHEMIHAYQDGIKRTGSRWVDHNAEFKRLASRVCSVHGWEVEKFV